jgi:hypothetical protein
MANVQNPVRQGGACGINDPVKINPHPTISPVIVNAFVRHSEDGETVLAAALRAALAKKAVRQ